MLDKPRLRRTKSEIKELRTLLYSLAEEEAPTTVRHLFYRMVAVGAIEKTETDYVNVVIRLLTSMRMEGEMPFQWIADNTRFVLQPRTYDSVQEALMETAKLYRRRLWDEQDSYVEIWCEKDAIRSIVSEVTWEYDVPLMICRGQPSISFLYSTFEDLISKVEQGKDCHVYILTDFDRSGQLIENNIQNKMKAFWRKHFNYSPGDMNGYVDPRIATLEDRFGRTIYFDRLAVTEDQIEELNLPTRPPKSHERNGYTRNVELDAMPTKYLRDLVRDAIEAHIPEEQLAALKRVEEEERKQFLQIAERMGMMKNSDANPRMATEPAS